MKIRPRGLELLLCLAGCAWIGMVGLGWSVLLAHTFQPTQTSTTTEGWRNGADHVSPEQSETFQIVVFAHPLCPCTQATLAKLDESLTRLPEQTLIRIVFVTAGFPPSVVESSPTLAYAKKLPHVSVQIDDGGIVASQFGATVSGEVFAIAGKGDCLFHGGLTSGRGHLGASIGQQELELRARGGSREPYNGPVYGCQLPACRGRWKD